MQQSKTTCSPWLELCNLFPFTHYFIPIWSKEIEKANSNLRNRNKKVNCDTFNECRWKSSECVNHLLFILPHRKFRKNDFEDFFFILTKIIRAQIILVPMEYGIIDEMSCNNFEITLLLWTSTGTDFFI